MVTLLSRRPMATGASISYAWIVVSYGGSMEHGRRKCVSRQEDREIRGAITAREMQSVHCRSFTELRLLRFLERRCLIARLDDLAQLADGGLFELHRTAAVARDFASQLALGTPLGSVG